MAQNPMKFIKGPHSKKVTVPVRALTKEEQRRLIDVLQTENINYSRQMLLSLSLGLRMGEVNALHVEDVNFHFNRVTIRRIISRGAKGKAILSGTTKTRAGTRILTMTPSVKALLLDCIGDKSCGLIFAHNDKMITTSQVNSKFTRILKNITFLTKLSQMGKLTGIPSAIPSGHDVLKQGCRQRCYRKSWDTQIYPSP